MTESLFEKVDKERMGCIPIPLLEWYHKNARVLPWREHPTPYRVWVSEIMLQQTRVEAVRPYFQRFMEALPTIASLADASEETLYKLWEGLGYYSRVKNLQKAARVVMDSYGGQLPADHTALLALPGIGPYTAGAIASIAFGIPAAAVDGNVLRVLARLLHKDQPMHTQKAKKAAESLLLSILPDGFAGDFNQAMMELGATVCIPGNPRCAFCPLKNYCLGRAAGCAADLPVRPEKKARRIERHTVLIILCNQGVLLRQRPDKGLLGGLWEFPSRDGWNSPTEAISFIRELGGNGSIPERLEDSRHIFTHLEWHMIGYASFTPFFLPPDGWVWADGDALRSSFAIPSAYKPYLSRTLQLLQKA